MKKVIYIVLCVQLAVSSLYAQNNIIDQLTMNPEEKGDYKMNEFAYNDALSMYQKAFADEESNHQALSLKIADAYRKLNDQENAVKWYNKGLINGTHANADYYLHYAEALSSVKKYDEAKVWYNKYLAGAQNHQHAENRIKGIDNQKNFFKKVGKVEVEKAEFNSDASDFSPVLYNDGVVFASSRNSNKPIVTLFNWDESEYLDLFIASGEGVHPFQNSHNSKYHEGPASFYADGTKMVFTRNSFLKGRLRKNDEGQVNLMLFASELKDGVWSKPTPLSINNEAYSVGHPSVNAEGTVMYFSSDMPGGFGGVDIYRAAWDGSKWGEPFNLGKEVNTEGDEMFPLFVNDHLYFSSNAHQGLGGLDLFGIDLSKDKSGKVVNLGAPINTSRDDFGLTLFGDELSGYFSSNREEGLNKDDIFHFTSSVSLLRAITVKGTITDKYTNLPLELAKVKLMKDGQPVATVRTNAKGGFEFPLEEDANYQLVVAKDEYLGNSAPLTTVDVDEDDLTKNVVLTPDYSFGMDGLVFEKGTKSPLEAVHVKVVDNFTNAVVYEGKTQAKGDFGFSLNEAKIDDKVSYLVHIDKEGYLGRSVPFNAVLKEPGIINLSEAMDLSLDKVAVGADLGKLVDIKPIYFDLGKYSIRKDAAAELDKIVAIMIENPTIEIELGSHTDARGSASGNLRLSDKRAKASADYVVSQGIDKSRIVGKGYGEVLILNKCVDNVKCSEDEHQLNRRTEFKITKM